MPDTDRTVTESKWAPGSASARASGRIPTYPEGSSVPSRVEPSTRRETMTTFFGFPEEQTLAGYDPDLAPESQLQAATGLAGLASSSDPFVAILHGKNGRGKTWVACQVAAKHGHRLCLYRRAPSLIETLIEQSRAGVGTEMATILGAKLLVIDEYDAILHRAEAIHSRLSEIVIQRYDGAGDGTHSRGQTLIVSNAGPERIARHQPKVVSRAGPNLFEIVGRDLRSHCT